MNLSEFKASLVYRESARIGSKATEKPCVEKQNKAKTSNNNNNNKKGTGPCALNPRTWEAEKGNL